MNMNEMATAVSQKLPIIVLIYNNQVLGHGSSMADVIL